MSDQFVECAACAAKPGSPVLCIDCIRRRQGLASPATDTKNLPGDARALIAIAEIVGALQAEARPRVISAVLHLLGYSGAASAVLAQERGRR